MHVFVYMISILCASFKMAIPDSSTINCDRITTPRKSTATIVLVGKQISQLHSLQDEVSQYVATYRRSGTWITGRTFKFRKSKKKAKDPKLTKKKYFYTTKTSYKRKVKYPLAKERRNIIYTHFVNIFSFFNETMKKELLKSPKDAPLVKSDCYFYVFRVFVSECDFWYYTHGGMREIKTLLARVCTAAWLNPQRIIRVIKGCCQKNRFIFKRFTWRRLRAQSTTT